ncbi:MAG: M20/M25/M40 family metallo-hydrolase [Clostridia bacterium]
MINLLAGAIQIQTTADVNDENMPKLHSYIEKNFPLVNKNMEKTIVGQSLVYKYKGDDKNLMFCGHMDVVAANPESWDFDPYGATITDGFLYGRGAIDCKNVVIGLLCAMESLFEQGFKPKHTVYLAFGHDEEIGGPKGATQIVKMLKEQGVHLDLVLDEGGHVSADFLPDRNYATIALAEKNIMRLKITAPDKGGHAAYISTKTGLYRLSKAIIAIEDNPMPITIIPLIQKYKDTLAEFYPNLVENYENIAKNSPFVRTTIAPTMVSASKAANILPNNANVVCDIRMLPGQTIEGVVEHIKSVTQDLELEYEVIASSVGEGHATDFNSDYYKAVESLIKEKFDDAIVVPALMAGGTDARHYQEICDVVLRFMPMHMTMDSSKRIHTDNERISVESFEKAVDFYRTFIERNV